ncbi:MAG TPA: PKD domain-containing protein, partial [Chitinophagaceae bacterium]
PNGDFDKMEPFFGSIKLNSLIDMEVGPDGKLYLLEYGTGWFTKNPDAGLSCIDYNGGNRPPVINSIHVDKTSGILPFTVKATVDAKDLEKDKISYTWNFGNGKTMETKDPEASYTYNTPGDYSISVEAKDDKGASAKSSSVDVYAGNETPQVSIDITGGNKSFYLPGLPVKYNVTVTDKNDTAKFDPANLYVSVDYVANYDKANEVGNQGQANISGKILTQTLDCKSCHKENDKSIGPAFMQVSEKYVNDPKASSYLSQKIMKGGSGVWGDVAMAAHPNISQSDLQQIVTWILSLAGKTTTKKSLPQSGSIVPPSPAVSKGGGSLAMMLNQKPTGVMAVSASYTDKGSNNTKALTGNAVASLRSNNWSFTGKEKVNKFTTFKYNGNNLLIFPPADGWFAIDSIDLTGVHSVNLISGWQAPPRTGFSFELRLDKPDGLLVGKGTLPPPSKGQQYGITPLPVKGVTDNNFHTLYFVYKGNEAISGGVVSLQFNAK